MVVSKIYVKNVSVTERQTEAHSMTMTDRQSSNTDILTEIDRQRDIDWLSVGRSDLYIDSTHLQRLYNLIRNHMTQFDKLFNSLKAAILPNIALHKNSGVLYHIPPSP